MIWKSDNKRDSNELNVDRPVRDLWWSKEASHIPGRRGPPWVMSHDLTVEEGLFVGHKNDSK